MNKTSLIIIVLLVLGFGIFQYSKIPKDVVNTDTTPSTSTNMTVDYSDKVMEDGVIEENKDSKTEPTKAPATNTTSSSKPIEPTTTSTTKSYTLAEVSMHNTETDCYTVINSKVYDVSAYIHKHPGGDKNILKICGKDGTQAFEGQHGGQYRPEQTLSGFEIGILR